MIVLMVLLWPAHAQAAKPAAAPSASPTPTDFSQVNEILGGRRLLFPEDDIIETIGGGPLDSEVFTTVLQTSGGNISAQLPNDVGGPTSFAVTAARVFNLPEDVVVTFGAGSLTLQTTGFDQRFNNPLPGAPIQNVSAMTDLMGDGLPDLAYIENGAIQIVPRRTLTTCLRAFSLVHRPRYRLRRAS